MLSFAYETYLDTIMTLPSIAIEVFGKTQAWKTRDCGAHSCQCCISNHTMISYFLYTLWLGTGFVVHLELAWIFPYPVNDACYCT